MLITVEIIAICIVCYLIGSITTGDVVARIKRVNLRSHGSGNVGATNAFRTMGTASGAIVLIGDTLKGVIAVLLGNQIKLQGFDFGILTGILAIIGHNWPVFAGFKGGKGMAVSLGVVIALTPIILVILIPVWVVVFVCFGFVSLASLVTVVFYTPVIYLFFPAQIDLIIFALLVSIMAIYRHKSNITRLIKGEEHRILYQTKKERNS